MQPYCLQITNARALELRPTGKHHALLTNATQPDHQDSKLRGSEQTKNMQLPICVNQFGQKMQLELITWVVHA